MNASLGNKASECLVLESVLDDGLAIGLLKTVEDAYASIDVLRRGQGVEAAPRSLPPQRQFIPHASSFGWSGVCGEGVLASLLGALAGGKAGRWLKETLGGPVACDLNQAWFRRQYAPHRYPPGHAPHGWHQDGALGFDFHTLGREPGPEDLLPLATCWMPLTPCGRDAPGLELMVDLVGRLLTVPELADCALRHAHPPGSFLAPAMRPGDALLFLGSVPHRTHVLPEMRKDRTSLELRFVRADCPPARLKGDRFVELAPEQPRSII